MISITYSHIYEPEQATSYEYQNSNISRKEKIQKETFGVLGIVSILCLVGFMSTYTHVKTLWQ